jgi:hypothetical protein
MVNEILYIKALSDLHFLKPQETFYAKHITLERLRVGKPVMMSQVAKFATAEMADLMVLLGFRCLWIDMVGIDADCGLMPPEEYVRSRIR